jgi:hypothetical protein
MMFPKVILNLIGDYCGSEQTRYNYRLIFRYKQCDDGLIIKVERRSDAGKTVRKIMVPGKNVYKPPIMCWRWGSVKRIIAAVIRTIEQLDDFEPSYPMKDCFFYHGIRVRMDKIAIDVCEILSPREVLQFHWFERELISTPKYDGCFSGVRDLLAADREDQLEMVRTVNENDYLRNNATSFLLTDTRYSHEFQKQMQDPEFFNAIREKLKWTCLFLEKQRIYFVNDYRFEAFSRW